MFLVGGALSGVASTELVVVGIIVVLVVPSFALLFRLASVLGSEQAARPDCRNGEEPEREQRQDAELAPDRDDGAVT